MAFDIVQMLGLGKKSPDMSGIMNAPTQKYLTDFPTGKALEERILAALQGGKGIGFGSDFVSRTTNPAIAQRQARFTERELPMLESELSGRGLGRSSIAGESLMRAGQAKERDIDELIANAYLQQEQQKKLDEARYENLASGLAAAESGVSGAVASDILGRETLGFGEASARKAQDQDLTQRIIAGLVGAATGNPQAVINAAMPSGAVASTGDATTTDLIKAIPEGLSKAYNYLKNLGPFVSAGGVGGGAGASLMGAGA
jgi:hypothetical protein